MTVKRLICFLLFALVSSDTLDATASFSTMPLDSLLPEDILLWAEEMPQFPDEDMYMEDYIEAHIQYPEAAKTTKLEGAVHLKFVVLEGGSLYGIRVVKSAFPVGLGFEEEAIRVVESMPKLIPAREKGVSVKVYYHLPVNFSLNSLSKKEEFADDAHLEEVKKEEALEGEQEEEVHVETMPEFPGGQSKLFRFIADNIKYPPKARNAGIGGTVFIGFVVMEDGSLKRFRVKKGVAFGGESLEAEALRVLELMPNWIAGTQDGEPVRVAFTLPIRFKVEGLRKPKKKRKKKGKKN